MRAGDIYCLLLGPILPPRLLQPDLRCLVSVQHDIPWLTDTLGGLAVSEEKQRWKSICGEGLDRGCGEELERVEEEETLIGM